MKPEQIRKILDRDALDETERMTGASYKKSEFTMSMGFFNHMEAVKDRENAMLATDDTCFSNTMERYLKIAHRIGFKIALEIPFTKGGHNERMFVLWRDGILLCFDTFMGPHVNGGNFYYNWEPSAEYLKDGHPRVTSSGCFERKDPPLWVGNHDCREALAFHIYELEKYGRILPKWEKRPSLWLQHHGDPDTGKDIWAKMDASKKLNEERILMLPKHVQEALS